MEDGPVNIVEILARRASITSSEALTISARLEKRFGLGQRPEIRKALYRKVESWVASRGEKALSEISRVVAQAVSARHPGKYFASTIRRVMAGQEGMVDW